MWRSAPFRMANQSFGYYPRFTHARFLHLCLGKEELYQVKSLPCKHSRRHDDIWMFYLGHRLRHKTQNLSGREVGRRGLYFAFTRDVASNAHFTVYSVCFAGAAMLLHARRMFLQENANAPASK